MKNSGKAKEKFGKRASHSTREVDKQERGLERGV